MVGFFAFLNLFIRKCKEALWVLLYLFVCTLKQILLTLLAAPYNLAAVRSESDTETWFKQIVHHRICRVPALDSISLKLILGMRAPARLWREFSSWKFIDIHYLMHFSLFLKRTRSLNSCLPCRSHLSEAFSSRSNDSPGPSFSFWTSTASHHLIWMFLLLHVCTWSLNSLDFM